MATLGAPLRLVMMFIGHNPYLVALSVMVAILGDTRVSDSQPVYAIPPCSRCSAFVATPAFCITCRYGFANPGHSDNAAAAVTS